MPPASLNGASKIWSWPTRNSDISRREIFNVGVHEASAKTGTQKKSILNVKGGLKIPILVEQEWPLFS